MNISEYLVIVVGAASLGIIADIVNSALSDRVKGLEKYIKFGVTLCVASCMVLPLLNITKNSGWITFNMDGYCEIIAKDMSYNSNYILERECEGKLAEEIFAKAGIKPLNISIRIETEENKTIIKKAEITLRKEDIQNTEKVQEIALGALSTKAEVIVEE